MDASAVTTTIITTINEIFYKIFASIDNNLYAILDKFTFINSDIFNDKCFYHLFGSPNEVGILLVANALIFGFLLYYAFRLLFAYLGVSQAERPSQFIFKLIVFGICMNFSLFICSEIVELNSSICVALRQIGENLYSETISFATLIDKLNHVISVNQNDLDIFSLDGIIKSLISFGILNLVITYAVRYMLIEIFILISPFAFLSLCTTPTSVFFKAWIKSFISLLLIQDFVAIVLLLIFSLNFSASNLFSKFVLLASIFILIKSNTYVREMLGGLSTDFSMGIQNIKSILSK